MTEEEYFRKNYPDYCYGDRLLSPYWDLFQYGVEFGERQSEKKITELKTELTKKADINHSLVEQMAKLEEENAGLKEKNNQLTKKCDCLTICNDELQDLLSNDIDTIEQLLEQRTKAKEIILKLYNAGRNVLMCRAEEKAYDNLSNAINDKSIEQFLKEIEE